MSAPTVIYVRPGDEALIWTALIQYRRNIPRSAHGRHTPAKAEAYETVTQYIEVIEDHWEEIAENILSVEEGERP